MSDRIGVDESGKGDYFGPLVIAACYVGEVQEASLEGVMDSKKLSDKKVMELEKEIKRVCKFSVIAIGPTKYNELYEKIGNLNRLLEWGHAQAIENVLKEQPCDLAISDQFAKPAGLLNKLKRKSIEIELVSMVRAESDLAVAAASVLARAEFLRRLKKLGDEISIPLPKGAGSNVDATAKNLVASKGVEILSKIAKLHFKTTDKVLGKI